MGKGEERNGTTAQAGESTFLAKSSNEASKMLEAALLQMDDIISGTNVIYGYIKFGCIRFECIIYMDILSTNIRGLCIFCIRYFIDTILQKK